MSPKWAWWLTVTPAPVKKWAWWLTVTPAPVKTQQTAVNWRPAWATQGEFLNNLGWKANPCLWKSNMSKQSEIQRPPASWATFTKLQRKSKKGDPSFSVSTLQLKRNLSWFIPLPGMFSLLDLAKSLKFLLFVYYLMGLGHGPLCGGRRATCFHTVGLGDQTWTIRLGGKHRHCWTILLATASLLTVIPEDHIEF